MAILRRFNKKGTAGSENWMADYILFAIIYIFFVGLTAVWFSVAISNNVFAKTKIYENLESFSLVQRFIKSPECFILSKDKVVSNNVIDAGKFDEQRLNSCYSISDSNIPAFKLRLISANAGINKEIKTANWNNNRPFEERKNPRQVLVYSEDKIYNGELTIEMQNVR